MINSNSILDKSYLLRQTVLNIILQQRMVSRSTISSMAGIRPSTITDVAKELIEERVIREAGYQAEPSEGEVSRRDLMINEDYARIIGVDVQSNRVLAVLTNFCGAILKSVSVPTQEDYQKQDIVQVIFESVDQLRQAAGSAKILGIGVSTIGILNRKTDTVLLTFSRANWSHVDLRAILAERYDLPVFIEDQVICKLYAEKWLDKDAGDVNTILVDSGDVLGCSMYFNKAMLRNSQGICGEIGHFSVGEGNEICSCGNVNCLLMSASSGVIIRKVRKTLENGTISALNDMTGYDLSRLNISMILEAATHGDRVAGNILTTAALYVGQAIAYIINLLGPEQVILSGSMVSGSDFFANTVIAEAKKRSLCLIADSICFRKASFLEYGGALGAACMPMERFFAFPNYIR